MSVQLIEHYFPIVSVDQKNLFSRLEPIYTEWNSKINLISRPDIDNLYIRHILHSLAIAKFINFKSGTTVLDIGTGGGFPGIPLAILFPEVQFTLVDSIAKKIRVVEDVILQLNLKNVTAICERAEKLENEYEFVVSRATAPLNDLYKWSRTKISRKQKNAVPNGIICLKGGDLTTEIQPFKGRLEIVQVNDYFKEPWFDGKFLIFLPL